jgi:hypothetical protein
MKSLIANKLCRRRSIAGLLIAAGSLGVASSPAGAQAYHNSYMAHPYCLSVAYVPGDCTGFIVGSGVTVEMICWNTGPQALGQGKWFEITAQPVRCPHLRWAISGCHRPGADRLTR